MFRRICFGLLALSCLGSVAFGQRGRLPTDAETARHGLTRKWFNFAPVDGIREKVQTITVHTNQIHVQTSASRVHAFNAETGEHLWSQQVGPPRPNPFGTGANSNSIFAVSGANLYRLGRDDGTVVWNMRLPSPPNAAPAADDDHVMIPTADGRLHVINIEEEEVDWYYQTNGAISVPGVFIEDRMACASEDGFLYVFAKSDVKPVMIPLFRYRTGSAITAPIAVWNNTVLVPEDYNLWAVDSRTRADLNQQTVWRYPSGDEIRTPITVVADEVYVTPTGEGMHALDAATGRSLWRLPRASGFVAASKSTVYARDRTGNLMIASRESGRLRSVWRIPGFTLAARNSEHDRIYIASDSGMIVCLHDSAHKDPLVHNAVEEADADAPAAAQAP